MGSTWRAMSSNFFRTRSQHFFNTKLRLLRPLKLAFGSTFSLTFQNFMVIITRRVSEYENSQFAPVPWIFPKRDHPISEKTTQLHRINRYRRTSNHYKFFTRHWLTYPHIKLFIRVDTCTLYSVHVHTHPNALISYHTGHQMTLQISLPVARIGYSYVFIVYFFS